MELSNEYLEQMEAFNFNSPSDGLQIQAYRWRINNAVARVQLLHGAAEHASRYRGIADQMGQSGIEVWANDHRGHGASIDHRTPRGSFGVGGWRALLDDIRHLSGHIDAVRPNVPHFLIGHSMGALAAQYIVLDDSSSYTGVVLTGSSAIDVMATEMSGAIADSGGSLSAFNSGFEWRTGYEWLSRDESQVDAYVADSLCGFAQGPDMLPQMMADAHRTGDRDELRKIDPDLRILITGGDADPVARKATLLPVLAERYRDAGVRDVSLRVYPEARHQLLFETNRDEVVAQIADWILGTQQPSVRSDATVA